MKNKKWLRALSIVLAFAILIACIPMTVSANEASVHFGVLSDIHYYPVSLMGNRSDEWNDFVYYRHREFNEGPSIVANALDGVLRNAVENGANYLLIPGDLTKDGELEGHIELAAKLEAFQEETGIPVFVINGNHDIYNSNVTSFKNDTEEKGTRTSPEQFREIYANLGYDKADSFFVPKPGNRGGMLSYAADLGDDYRLIVVDTCMYTPDNGAKGEEHLTDGRVGDDLLEWVLDEAHKATENGRTIVCMQHHNIVPAMDIEEATFFAFVLEDWERIADAYADAGIHYVFSGHLHSPNVSSYVSDNGEKITDILTDSLTAYPNTYRTIDFVSDGSKIEMTSVTHAIDEYQPVVSLDGTVYPQPYSLSSSFAQTFGDDIEKFVIELVTPIIKKVFVQAQEQGGIVNYLKSSGLDLEQIIINALGTNGLEIAGQDIITVRKNVMSFINDFGSQIDEVYINDFDGTMAKIETILAKLLSLKVSDSPATYLAERRGKQVSESCNLAEMAESVILQFYWGDEDISAYPEFQEMFDAFNSGVLFEELFNLLREVLVTDLVQNELLANLKFNPGTLFPGVNGVSLMGKILQGVTVALLGGDNSFKNLVESVLGIVFVPEEYSSVDNIIDTLLGEYLTFSQFESWGKTVSWMIGSLVIDSNPTEKADNDVVITYTGKTEVEATQDNYRLPANIVMNLAEDPTTEMYLTWYTKYSLTEGTVQITDYSETPTFGNSLPSGVKVECSSETIARSYPGADLGLYNLSFLPYYKDYVKHSAKISGLEPGTKYSYRVGNEEYGWWSDAGVIETATGGDEAVSFIFLSDPQAQNPEHYERYSEVINAAIDTYPDAKFIVSAGDHVDAGQNVKQWHYFLSSSDTFMRLPLMPTTGNHEVKEHTTAINFTLPNVPEQDTETGVYYSYDYNNIHFTVLNTNDIVDKKYLSSEQMEWLKADIKASDADWKIVVLHKAPYSNGSHYDDKDVEGIRKQLAALLPYLGVDLVLQGHDHVYLRTDVLNANVVVPAQTNEITYNGYNYAAKKDPMGTIYSICSTSGVKVYKTKDVAATDKAFPRAEKLYDNDYSMFAGITVDGDTLYYNAFEVNDGANCVDTFAITKSANNTSTSEKVQGTMFEKLADKLAESLTFGKLWKVVNAIVKVLVPVFNALKYAFC